MTVDWTGNDKSIYSTLGASNHSVVDREQNDYYATEPRALEMLLELEKFYPYVWECACGEGHLSEVLKRHGYYVRSSDIIDRGYPGTEILDFLKVTVDEMNMQYTRDIITNPPYKYAKEFVEHALDISMDGTKVAMFLKLQFLEGKARKALFKKYPPTKLYVSSERLKCAPNGNFEKVKSSAVAYAWFIWEKGYKGETIVRWFN